MFLLGLVFRFDFGDFHKRLWPFAFVWDENHDLVNV